MIDDRMKAGPACTALAPDPPSDPYFLAGLSWGLEQASDIDVDAEGAWSLCRGSQQVIVAILDDGVDPNHPELMVPLLSALF